METVLRGRCWVIDGDTIVINNIRVRLAGIDAPELDHPWGQRSKWALVQLCKGQTVTARIKPVTLAGLGQSHSTRFACRLPLAEEYPAGWKVLICAGLKSAWLLTKARYCPSNTYADNEQHRRRNERPSRRILNC